MEGVGSIWNKNSWHWEEKNYSPKAKEYITQHLQAIAYEVFTPRASELTITKITEIKGSANISIRKKKQVLIYEFEVECEWEAHEREGDEEAKGKLKILEFYQDDDPDDVQIEVTADKTDEYHESARQQVQNTIRARIIKVVEGLKELMFKVDADEKKLRADHELRMKQEEEVKQAVEAKGTEKQAIFEEARKKEQEMKQKEEAMKQEAKVIQEDKGQGSIWNANSYFWEEKNYNKWSIDKIQELLGNFKHTVPGGTLEVTDCEVTGEASISIRKGKKIRSYDFVITLKWNVLLKNGEEEEKVTGEFKLPEVSNAVYDDGDEFDINIEYKTGQEHRDKINDHVRGDVITAIKKNLVMYVEDFKQQAD